MVKKSKNLKKTLKNHFNVAEEKKCYPLSFPKLGERNSTRALQSSPFHISGGSPERDKRTDKGRKPSCLILDWMSKVVVWKTLP